MRIYIRKHPTGALIPTCPTPFGDYISYPKNISTAPIDSNPFLLDPCLQYSIYIFFSFWNILVVWRPLVFGNRAVHNWKRCIRSWLNTLYYLESSFKDDQMEYNIPSTRRKKPFLFLLSTSMAFSVISASVGSVLGSRWLSYCMWLSSNNPGNWMWNSSAYLSIIGIYL